MTTPEIENTTQTDAAGAAVEETPENVPPRAWLTYAMFAAFVVGLGSCASLWMFN